MVRYTKSTVNSAEAKEDARDNYMWSKYEHLVVPEIKKDTLALWESKIAFEWPCCVKDYHPWNQWICSQSSWWMYTWNPGGWLATFTWRSSMRLQNQHQLSSDGGDRYFVEQATMFLSKLPFIILFFLLNPKKKYIICFHLNLPNLVISGKKVKMKSLKSLESSWFKLTAQ